MFNHQILDMIEVGVEECKTMQEMGNCNFIEVGQQPILIFQGDAFDLSENHIRFKNMMLDFFRIKHLKNLNILEAHRVITFTAKTIEDGITMQQFEAGKITEGLSADANIDVKEVGPIIKMKIRRVRHPDNEQWKAATRIMKSKKKALEKKRNITKNELGQRIGKAFIQHQDLATLGLRHKRRKVREGEKKGKDEHMPIGGREDSVSE
jgi:ribosome production factor 2